MFNILSFLQRGWSIFKKGGIGKRREMIYKKEGLDPLGNYVIYDTRSSKACIVCSYVCLLTSFLNIRLFKVFAYGLEFLIWKNLMQFNFRERFTFQHKGPKLGFSWFFHKIVPSHF